MNNWIDHIDLPEEDKSWQNEIALLPDKVEWQDEIILPDQKPQPKKDEFREPVERRRRFW